MRKISKESRKENKQINKKGVMFLCLLLFAVCGIVLFSLNEMRKELITECEDELLWNVQQSAKEISDSMEEKFALLETVQDLVSGSYTIGQEAAMSLEAARKRFHMSCLGLTDTEYNYYDSTGSIKTDAPKESVDAALSGEYVMTRVEGREGDEGIVFLIPYWEDGKIVGAISSKYTKQDILVELGAKLQAGAEVILHSSGTVVLMEDDFTSYLTGSSWEEFSERGARWKAKESFDEEMQLMGCAVASATGVSGKDIYFAAAQVDRYEEFYVLRIIDSDVVEQEIESAMMWIYLLMVVMTVFMFCIVGYAIISYLKSRKEIYNVAYVDQLTGIPSKTKHKMDAQERIESEEHRYAYVTFDVDNFKYINEMFGYEYGNRILIHIATVLRNFIKEGELCARISSDNFALLLVDGGTKKELTERIRELFTMIIDYREPEEELNVCALKFSAGVYRIDGVKDINLVRANANLARTECKKRVLEDVIFYDDELKTRRVEEKELEYDAEAAMENKEFIVYFQPKYDVDSEKIIGAEALIRWNHPVRGMLSPGLFVPVFETNGFIIELDLFVLDQVCQLIKSWLDAEIPPVCISVNLSRIHLYERNLVGRLVEVVKRNNVPLEYIEFELTESAFYEETESLLRVMAEIKEAGFRLSMDDFGSGYSSLNLLRRLPVDVLKLDRVFLEECDEEDDGLRGKRIVMHVISMAKDLRMEVLAEGVETADQKEFLKDAKCDMIQGYYYARPMPIDEFELLYKGQNGLKSTVH